MNKDDQVPFSSLSGKIVIGDDDGTAAPVTATATSRASDNDTFLIVDTLSLRYEDEDGYDDFVVTGNVSNAGVKDEETEDGGPCAVGINDVTVTATVSGNITTMGSDMDSMNDDAALAPGGETDFGGHVDDPHHTGNSECTTLDNLVMIVDDDYDDDDNDEDDGSFRGKDGKEYTDTIINTTTEKTKKNESSNGPIVVQDDDEHAPTTDYGRNHQSSHCNDDDVVLIIEEDSVDDDYDHDKYESRTNDSSIVKMRGEHVQQQDLEAAAVKGINAQKPANNTQRNCTSTRKGSLLPDICSNVDDEQVREFLRQVRLAPSRPPLEVVSKASKSSSTATTSQMENSHDNSSKATCSYDGKNGNSNDDGSSNNEEDDSRNSCCRISSCFPFGWNPISCRLSMLCRQRVRDFNAMHYPAKVISDTDDIFYYNRGHGGFWGGNALMHHFHRALSFSRHLPTCSFLFVIFTIFLAIGAFSAALGQYLSDTNHHNHYSINNGGNGTISNGYNDTDMMNSGSTVVPTPSPTSPLIALLTNIGNENDDTAASSTNPYHQDHDNRKPRQPLDWVDHDDHPHHPHV